MQNIRVMSWNVQNFGQTTLKDQQRKGLNSQFLAQFIGYAVQIKEIDILGVMEVMPDSQTHLDNVLISIVAATEDNTWCYDWIKGSVEQGVAEGEQYVTTPGDLTWRSGSNAPGQEGYAIFWRNGSQAFDMLPARRAMSQGARRMTNYKPTSPPVANAVSLSLEGRRTDRTQRTKRLSDGTTIRSWVPGLAASGFQPAGPWQWETSFYSYAGGAYDQFVYWARSRRPAYCAIRISADGGTQDYVIPIMFFHAPSRYRPARWSTYISGLAQELYVNRQANGALTYHDNAIAAGDYNTEVHEPNRWDLDYGSFHNPFGAAATAGANCTPLYDFGTSANYKTTVQLNHLVAGRFTGKAIESTSIADYYKKSIDEMFHRGLELTPNGENFYLWPVPAEVMANGSMVGAPVQVYANNLQSILDTSVQSGWGVDPDYGPKDEAGDYIFPFLTDWTTFYAGVQAGTLTDARSAAEFVREFVSDHFPIVIDFQV